MTVRSRASGRLPPALPVEAVAPAVAWGLHAEATRVTVTPGWGARARRASAVMRGAPRTWARVA